MARFSTGQVLNFSMIFIQLSGFSLKLRANDF
jgi:hypothetical protein